MTKKSIIISLLAAMLTLGNVAFMPNLRVLIYSITIQIMAMMMNKRHLSQFQTSVLRTTPCIFILHATVVFCACWMRMTTWYIPLLLPLAQPAWFYPLLSLENMKSRLSKETSVSTGT